MERSIAEALGDEAVLLAVAEVLAPSLNGRTSHRLADVVEQVVGPPGTDGVEPADLDWAQAALARLPDARVAFWTRELARLGSVGVRVISVGNPDYPSNLRMIHDRPPFLFVRGALLAGDERAVAVVGTRSPGPQGVETATSISEELARRGVTVISGLAKGIDTAAHEGALRAGGRTIAVFGTGIERVYPAQNRALAAEIEGSGACVSQFWPGSQGARWTFPVRNVVTSGLAVGTIVVEAGETSGARLQAENALRHGKSLFLMRDLVEEYAWAQEAAERESVMTVRSVDEVVEAIDLELRTMTSATL
jgi:DNA processing protein